MYGNVLPQRADVAYLFTHTPPEEDSILDRGAELYANNSAWKVVIGGGEEAYTTTEGAVICNGGKDWRQKLRQRGVADDHIVTLPRPDPFQTRTESETVVDYMVQGDLRSVIVVACPLHYPRALLTVTSSVVKRGVKIRVYGQVGKPSNWFEGTAVSQGQPVASRFEALEGEWSRINNPDYGLSLTEFIDYCRWRDTV